MENLIFGFFILNTFFVPISLFIVDKKIAKYKKLKTISEFVTIGKDQLIFLEVIFITSSVIHCMFCFYLFHNYNFPPTILLGILGGFISIIVAFLRIDKYFLPHTLLAVTAFLIYSLSIVLTSIALKNPLLIAVGIIQAVITIVGVIFKAPIKHLEVYFFTIFAIWNLLVIASL
ncbi:MAG: hypothetical protein ABIM99_00950 [Candidatus Dojkabacteria bacterium]